MAKQNINIGTYPNDGTGDSLRIAFDKINDNFTELYDGAGGGAANLGSFKISGSTLGTEGADANTWGASSIWIDPMSEGSNWIYIPNYTQQQTGDKFELHGYNGITLNSANTNILVHNSTLDAGTNSIDLKSSDYAELFYEGETGIWQANPSRNSAAYVWTAYDGTYIQNVRAANGEDNTWDYTWEFSNQGALKLPANGDIVDSNGNSVIRTGTSTVTPILRNVLTNVVSVPASNPNWLHGTGVAGSVANANISIAMTDGVPSFTINDAGLSGRYVGEPIFTVLGSALGGTDSIDDMVIEVSAIADTGSGVIDLTKPTHILETGDYTLADGYEGQVLHFILKSGATNVFNSIWIQVANLRYIYPNDATTSELTFAWWSPFYKANDNYTLNGVATAVFANGAWNLTGGIID